MKYPKFITNNSCIGIICPSDIATRRFLPAVNQIQEIEFAGVAVNTAEERYGNNK